MDDEPGIQVDFLAHQVAQIDVAHPLVVVDVDTLRGVTHVAVLAAHD